MKLIFYSIFFIAAITLDLGVKSIALLHNDMECMEVLLEMQSEKEGEEKEESKTEFTNASDTHASLGLNNLDQLNIQLTDLALFVCQHFAEIPVPPPDLIA